LTQRLCAFLTKSKDRFTKEVVEASVKDLFFGEKGMEDNNLQFVRDMLLERSADKTGVLKIYQRVIKDKKPIEDEEQSLNKSHLKLSGVVRRRQTTLRVSNLIYQSVFDMNWIKEHLPRIERRSVVVALGVTTALAILLAVLSVTGILNQIIYYPLKTEWVNVPAGEFTMGSTSEQIDLAVLSCKEAEGTCAAETFADELPVHSVYLDAYQIMRYEVTNKQYAQCVSNGTCLGQDNAGNIIPYLSDVAYADHPVVDVNWFQAQNYCQWIGARLPTESEWEKAARGTNGRIYPWGNDFNGNVANLCDTNCLFDWANKNYDDGYEKTSPVGSYPDGVGPYGVYDMAGNVWEWVADWYDIYPGGIPNVSSHLGQTDRVLRGGSWNVYSSIVRTANRGRGDPVYSDYLIGFRCSRDLLPSQLAGEFGEDVATKFALTAKSYKQKDSLTATASAPKNLLTATAFCQPLATSTPPSTKQTATPEIQNPKAMIEEFARQTVIAQTATVFSQVCHPSATPTSTPTP
jgi:formylglycine-generating enzyme required for sulfatase activity